MNRKYTREWYLDRVAAIRRIVPDCGLSTDIFSGYCSETEEDHEMSLSLMRECAYDSAFMFKYSEQAGNVCLQAFARRRAGGREGTAFERIDRFAE